MKWAFANGCKLDESVTASAALNGNLEMLALLIRSKCPYNENMANYAVLNNKINVIQWIISNNLNWNKEKCLKLASELNHTKILKYLLFVLYKNVDVYELLELKNDLNNINN